MKYLVYDFAKGTEPAQDKTLSWARAVLDMDPEIGLAVINDNNRFWAMSWLVDLKTEKREVISTKDWNLFVKREPAEKWNELSTGRRSLDR